MTHYEMNLDEYLRNMKGNAKMKEIFKVADQLVTILRIVHGSRRTFNDLKPDNIMITPPGQNQKL